MDYEKIKTEQHPDITTTDQVIGLAESPVNLENNEIWFGKYKGKKFSDLRNDYGYCRWLINNSEDRDIKFTMRAYLDGL